MKKRIAEVSRKTEETDIQVKINLDGEGKSNIKSDLPFLEHMLTLFCMHGFFDLEISMKGDLEVDTHHSMEDLGICLGRAIKEAAGDRAGIKRYGYFLVPMDEALARVVIDFSGRGRLFFKIPGEKINKISTIDGEVWEELFTALAYEGGLTLHIELLAGKNTHHILEAIFKAFAKALDQALGEEKRLNRGIPSTKGILA